MVEIMKKAIKLIAILLVMGVVFTGCAASENPNLSMEAKKYISNDNFICDEACDYYNLKVSLASLPASDYGGGGYGTTRFRTSFYSMPGTFADFVGREEYVNWLMSRCVEEQENEHVAVSFIRYFNISRADFERLNEERGQRIEEMNQVWIAMGVDQLDGAAVEILPVDLIFTFDNERIREYFRWENGPEIQRNLGIYPETVILSVEINVEAPIVGARTDLDMPEIDWSLNYIVHSITWSPEIMPFAANTTYTVTAIISARTGYTLEGLTTATINGRPAVISNNTGITARISYTFGDDFQAPSENQMIAAGTAHTIAIKADSTAMTWGFNFHGQLGDGTLLTRRIPVPVQTLTDVISGAVGLAHTAALRSNNTVWSWGSNVVGELGDGTTTNSITPVQTLNLSNVKSISISASHTVALRSDGTVWAWGSNGSGQLGDGTTTSRSIPTRVQNLTNVTAISAGSSHTVALRADGTVWAWGWNRNGQLGDGTWDTQSLVPVQVQDLTDIIAISAGWTHTVALREDGTVWTWGGYSWGQLANGGVSQRTPGKVQNLVDAIAISAGQDMTIVLRENGTVWSSGANWSGQLGDGTVTQRNTLVQVRNLTNITAISAGSSHTVALRRDGTVWAWGWNGHGQLGDGTITSRDTPVQVRGSGGVGFLNLFESVSNQMEREVSVSRMMADSLSYMFAQASTGGSMEYAVVNIIDPMTGAEPSQFAIGVGNFAVSDVAWSHGDGLFSSNTRYTVSITLTANEGYTFDGQVLAVINSGIAKVIENTGDTVTMSFEFPETN